MVYEELLTEADGQDLIVREKDIPGYGGRICGNRIAIRKDIETETEKACVLAEELGHHYTTVGDIMDQTDTGNRKQELQARIWAYNRLIGLQGSTPKTLIKTLLRLLKILKNFRFSRLRR